MQIVIADPSTVTLDPAPITPRWIVEGTPQARARELARSDDGTSVVVAWSCTAGRFNWHYSVDETVHVISGEVCVTNDDDGERRLGPGDMAFFPAGSSSLWRVPCEVRKLAVCRHSLPWPLGFALRAWRKLTAHRHRPWPARCSSPTDNEEAVTSTPTRSLPSTRCGRAPGTIPTGRNSPRSRGR